MRNCSSRVEKTLWEKEKLLIGSNFSFTHSVFKKLVLHTEKPGLVWERVNYVIRTGTFTVLELAKAVYNDLNASTEKTKKNRKKSVMFSE